LPTLIPIIAERLNRSKGTANKRFINQERRFWMRDESRILEGLPAVPLILMMAITPALTALVMSIPVAWLVNHVFAIDAIHAIFGVDGRDHAGATAHAVIFRGSAFQSAICAIHSCIELTRGPVDAEVSFNGDFT
jgi:hypothetical protein